MSNEQAALRITLFGRFEVRCQGRPLGQGQWKRRKTQTLLKVLLTRPGEVFSQDELVELVFPGLDPDKAIQNLHARISELRRALEPGLRHGAASRYLPGVGKGRYRFDPATPCWIDALSCTRALADAAVAEAGQDWVATATAYERALALCSGDYLAEDRYAEWAQAPQRHWDEAILQALSRLAAAYFKLGRFAAAVERLHQALARAPQREALYRELMRCHHQAGEVAEARGVYQQCQRRLSEQGLEPSEATRALHAALVEGGGLKSLAVLPFLQLSSRQEHTYFSDGLTEDIIARLAKIGELKVVSRTSVMRYKHTTKPLGEVGRALGVGAVLEGSVRSDRHRVCITARLVAVDNDATLWSERYERELTDIFAIQSEVARRIAEVLEARLSSAERARLQRPPTDNLKAYHGYLKGRYFWNKRTPAGLRRSVGFFQEAICLDPDYAQAHAGVADAYAILGWFGYEPGATMFPKAQAAARRALALDEDLAEAHTSLAYARMNGDWDWAGAQAGFERALALDPHYATAHHWHGEWLSLQGRAQAAVDALRRALALDPLSLVVNTVLAWKLCFADQLDEALAQCQKTLELDPRFGPAHTVLGLVHEQQGRFDEAIADFEAEITLSGDNAPNLASLGHALGLAGRSSGARAALEKLEQLNKIQPVSSYHFACVHVGLGQLDRAFSCLEKGLIQRDWVLPYIVVAPRFARLRGDPRFAALVRGMGLAPDAAPFSGLEVAG